jgi:hypothetical protein
LDDALRATARITPLDSAVGDIQGLSDQSGGGKRRRSGKGKKAMTKKVRAIRAKLVKMMKKLSRRKMRGGAALQTMADYGAPGMLLSPAQEAKAMMGMNPEWKLASDPAAFAPK